ncbi:MAG: hypothetical protein PVJ37_16775, partial [Desulfobacterales bacterium]
MAALFELTIQPNYDFYGSYQSLILKISRKFTLLPVFPEESFPPKMFAPGGHTSFFLVSLIETLEMRIDSPISADNIIPLIRGASCS